MLNKTNQRGAAPVLILLAVIGLVAFLLIAANAPFKEQLAQLLYPKPESHAATSTLANLNLDPPVNYDQDVETWWANHPFNPQNPNQVAVGDIISPTPIVDVAAGADLTQAINNLPAAGGTLRLAAGNYAPFSIIKRSNIHVISNGGANIKSASILGHPLAEVYHDYVDCLKAHINCDQTTFNGVLDTFLHPSGNIYFKNITFDGGGEALEAVHLSVLKRVVFDNVTFQNYAQVQTYIHPGMIAGSAAIDQFWCRKCNFLGTQTWAVYLDGTRGSGFIDNFLDGRNFFAGGYLFFNNDDVTVDENNNGTYEQSELRYPQYNIFYNNNFANALFYDPIHYDGATALVKNNTMDGSYHLASIGALCAYSNIGKQIVYNGYGNKFIGNRANWLINNFISIANAGNGNDFTCDGFPASLYPHNGKYTIKDNYVGDLRGPIVTISGTADPPNVVSNNCFSGRLDGGAVCTAPPSPTQAPTPRPTVTPTILPTSQPTPNTSPIASSPFFYGIFEDANRQGDIGPLIDQLKTRNMDTIVFTNNNAFDYLPGNPSDESMLTTADSKNFKILFAPHWELNHNYVDGWYDTVPEDLNTIRQKIYPIADKLKNHSSLLGYSVIDDASNTYAKKLQYVVQAFKERDPVHPASPVYVGGHDDVYKAANSSAFLTYEYPAKAVAMACDWSGGSRYVGANNITQFIDQVTRFKDPNVPTWFIGQVHGSTKVTNPSANPTDLREPTVEEVRRQHWEALAAGIRGMSWFIWSTQQWWTGLKDNPPLLTEITDLATRLQGYKNILSTLKRVENRFTVSATTTLPIANQPNVTTFQDPTGKYYVVVVNSSCAGQTLRINSDGFAGQLRDVETNQTAAFNTNLSFRGGDGKLFELVNATVPAQAPLVNMITNPSFEIDNAGFPNSWSRINGAARDATTAHSGTASLKFTGASSGYTTQDLTIKPHIQYSFSYWVRTQNVNTGWVNARFVQFQPSVETKETEQVKGTTNGWRQVSETFYASDIILAARFDIQWSLAAGETAWVDDMQFCEGKRCFALSIPSGSSTPAPTVAPSPTPVRLQGDADGNGKVDIFDYNIVLRDYGKTGILQGDLDKDNDCDIFDYNIVLRDYGKSS